MKYAYLPPMLMIFQDFYDKYLFFSSKDSVSTLIKNETFVDFSPWLHFKYIFTILRHFYLTTIMFFINIFVLFKFSF